MTMPVDLFLVRHGESEGNVASKRSKKGDDRDFTSEFLNRHSSKWHLTDKGIAQARAASAWFRDNVGRNISRFRCYVSSYVRAMETACNLDLPGAKWYVEDWLRERDWGALDVMTETERRRRFAEDIRRRDIDPFHWTPTNGESLAGLRLRVDRVNGTLHRECGDGRVVIVGHGEWIWMERFCLERLTVEKYLELDRSKHPFDRIHNCQIIHYTRVNPTDGTVLPSYQWVRSICPWDTSLSSNEWTKIERQSFTNDQLRLMVEKVSRLIPE